MNLEASHLDEAEHDGAGGVSPGAARAATMKFTYPSGSRPLDGYTVKRGVGRGGFGEVYFATSDAGKEVALKLIRRNLEVELRGVRQCLNLKHPNLIGLYDIRTDEMGDQWVIMEYVSGESLEDVIDRQSDGMPVGEALWWMRAICAGVAHLHDHGIVHRDLKPGNIFLDEGTVKIGDYGLAKFISCSRRSGQTESVGTVHYMAPEIANGRYGREIDTYALGIILFEMLTGHVPFEGESVGEVLMKHLTAEPDLSLLQEPYRDIVRRSLAKDPEARIKSVDEMLSLLPEQPAGAAPAAAVRPVRRDEQAAGAVAGSPVVGAAAPTATDGGVADVEEPIWKAIREVFASLRSRWYSEEFRQMHPLAKALLIFAVIVIALNFVQIVIAVALPTLACYGIYYLVWIFLIRPGARQRASQAGAQRQDAEAQRVSPRSPTAAWPAPEQPASPTARYAQSVQHRRQNRLNWRDAARRQLAAKPLRDKLSELFGSMLLAAMVAVLAALVAPLLLGHNPPSERVAMHLWLALVGTLGSWAILVPAKFAEGRLEDHVPLRMTLLLLGGLLGAAAWGLGDVLLVHAPGWHEPMQVDAGLISQEMLDWSRPATGANPSLAAYVAYFAFLFVLLRWWRQAEYTRSARLSIWSVVVCLFWAWFLHLFWWFPQPTGMMAAGVIAVSIQLASPWMPPSRRRAVQLEVEQA
jgi:hypothetical protein